MNTESVKVKLNLNDQVHTVNMPRKLCIIRHVNSWFNHLRTLSVDYPEIMAVFHGNSKWDYDIRLSHLGKSQGSVLNSFWKDVINNDNSFTNYLSSPYRRTCDTIEYITQDYKKSDFLIEKGSGFYYGYSQLELVGLIPNYSEQKKDRWNSKIGPKTLPPELLTESYREVCNRLLLACYEVPIINTAICTHGEVVTGLRYMIEAPQEVRFNDFLKDTIQSDYAKNGDIYEYDFWHRVTRNHRIFAVSDKKLMYVTSPWQPLYPLN